MKRTNILTLALCVGIASTVSGQGFLGESWVEATAGRTKVTEGDFQPEGYGVTAAVNLPTAGLSERIGLDFRFEGGYLRVSQGGVGMSTLGFGISAPAYMEFAPWEPVLKPFLAPNVGVTRVRGGNSSTSAFLGLTFGVEVQTSEQFHITPSLDYGYHTNDSTKTISFDLQMAYSFTEPYAVLIGFGYTDVQKGGSSYTIYGGFRMRF
ncbi:MAG: hypothetical protein JJU00_04440 [Opitutales bacterium]|nr:hypothetical protein [Opitutales bacterium]